MTRIHIKTFRPMTFEDKLLICLDGAWSNLFQDISFDADIVNWFLRIQSTHTIRK